MIIQAGVVIVENMLGRNKKNKPPVETEDALPRPDLPQETAALQQPELPQSSPELPQPELVVDSVIDNPPPLQNLPQPPLFPGSTVPPAKVRVKPAAKPMSWIAGSMIYGLAESLLGTVALLSGGMMIGVAVLAGLLTRSVALGLLLGVPMAVMLTLWVIWAHPRFVRWSIKTLGYEVPGFWQTWAALAWGNLLFALLAAVLLAPLAWIALGTGSSSRTGLVSLIVFAFIALPLLHMVATGWTLSESFDRSPRASKAVAWVYIVLQVLVVLVVVAGSAFSLRELKHLEGGNRSGEKATIQAAQIAAVYYTNHNKNYGSRVSLARDICAHSRVLRVDGWAGSCDSLQPAPWNPKQKPQVAKETVWIGRVEQNSAEICASAKDSQAIYCLIVQGGKPSRKGFSKENLGLALQSARENLGF